LKRRAALLLVAAVIVTGLPAAAYLKLGTPKGGQLITLKFSKMPVRYFITNRDVPGVTAPQLRDAAGRAFASWSAVPNVSLSSEFVGFTGAQPLSGDNATVLGFSNRPDLERVLGSTSFTVDSVTGELVESDIFFNSTFNWSSDPAGQVGRQDIESLALHEIGHLLGLGHSMIGETELFGGGRSVLGTEAVMFPIAFSAGTLNRVLRADDIAGMSDIYGNDTFRRETGSITGRVTKNATGIVGAHVTAFNPASGKIVGGFTLSQDGTFTIAGLEPGPHVVRVEPLDDADVGSFLDTTLTIDVNFRPAFYSKLVTVPRGGTSASIAIAVVAK